MNYLFKAVRYAWAFPLSFLGLLYCLTLCPSKAQWRRGALELRVRYFWWPGNFAVAQSWGHVIMYRSGYFGHPGLRNHERVHTHQAELLGPTMIILYPLASLWAVIRGKHYYRDNAFEVWARRESGKW